MPFAIGVFILLALGPLPASAQCERYTYRSLDSLSPVLEFGLTGKLIGSGHTTYSWSDCSDERHVCLDAPGASIHFSIPRQLPENGKWQFRGVSYRLSKIGRFCFAGRCYNDVHVVDSQVDGVEYTYAYSRMGGVISILVQQRENVDVLILQQELGFGASQTCED